MAEIEARVVKVAEGAGEERIYIHTPYRFRETCASMHGSKWSNRHKAWSIPATTAGAGELARRFAGQDIEMCDVTRGLVDRAAKIITAQVAKGAVDLADTPTQTVAWLHQRRAFAFVSELQAGMLAMDMGTGKSLVTIALWQHRDVRTGLIVCPVNVVGVWPKQFRIHAQDPDEWCIIAPQPGRSPILRRVQYISEQIKLARRRGQRVVVVVNFESAWRDPMATFIRDMKWDDAHIDESHRLKSAGGKASLFVTGLRKHTTYRGTGTGTPMPHSPLDIYAQYRFLDPGIYGTSKNRFVNRYAVTQQRKTRGGQKYDEITDWQNMDEFEAKFHSIAYVVTSEEALPDLPEAVHSERRFDLGSKALHLYKAMAKDLIGQVGDGDFVVAANTLTKILRLRQITSGIAALDTGETVVIDDAREKALYEYLVDLPENEPVVVFAAFKPDLEAIERVAAKLGRRYGELSGRSRGGLSADSTMSPHIDILGCQLRSGGVGIDLTRARYGVYYSIGYELADYRQSIKRLHRPGARGTVYLTHLVAENADIDTVMYDALQERGDLVDAIVLAAREKRL